MSTCPAHLGRLIYQGFFEPDFIPFYDHPQNRPEAIAAPATGSVLGRAAPGSSYEPPEPLQVSRTGPARCFPPAKC